MGLLTRFVIAKIDITAKHLASTMRKRGFLHRTRFHRFVIKIGQRYYTGPVSDKRATKTGAEMLVCYTLCGVTNVALVWQLKILMSPTVMRDREDRAQAKAMDDEKIRKN